MKPGVQILAWALIFFVAELGVTAQPTPAHECKACDYTLHQPKREPPCPSSDRHELTIRVEDEEGKPLIGSVICPEFYASANFGPHCFKQSGDGVFVGEFPAHDQAWAKISIKSDFPGPIGRGHFKLQGPVDKDEMVTFRVQGWRGEGRRLPKARKKRRNVRLAQCVPSGTSSAMTNN